MTRHGRCPSCFEKAADAVSSRSPWPCWPSERLPADALARAVGPGARLVSEHLRASVHSSLLPRHRVLLRVRMLYYLKAEVLGEAADKAFEGTPAR